MLDTSPLPCYNTPMENEKFNDDLEIGGDLQDEYQAIQEAEAGVEPEMASDEEIKELLTELWHETWDGGQAPDPQCMEILMGPDDNRRLARDDRDIADQDAFREYWDEQYGEFN